MSFDKTLLTLTALTDGLKILFLQQKLLGEDDHPV